MMLVEHASKSKTEQFKMAMMDEGIPDITVATVMSSVSGGEELIRETFDLFSSSKRIEKYFEENFDYVKPKTVSLGNGTFQYVPVRKLLQKIVADKTFQKHRKTLQETIDDDDGEDRLLQDVEDGLLYQNNNFFKTNRDALRWVKISRNYIVAFGCSG